MKSRDLQIIPVQEAFLIRPANKQLLHTKCVKKRYKNSFPLIDGSQTNLFECCERKDKGSRPESQLAPRSLGTQSTFAEFGAKLRDKADTINGKS